MSSRRQAREWALQMLFQTDFRRRDIDDALADFWREQAAPRHLRAFAERLVRGVLEKRAEVDAAIQTHSLNWDLHRLGRVDRTVLRIAVYEMLYCMDIPPVVSINEAIDIARDFSSQESARFVNGILDEVLRGLTRSPREAQPAPDSV